MKFLSLAALEVVQRTTSTAASDKISSENQHFRFRVLRLTTTEGSPRQKWNFNLFSSDCGMHLWMPLLVEWKKKRPEGWCLSIRPFTEAMAMPRWNDNMMISLCFPVHCGFRSGVPTNWALLPGCKRLRCSTWAAGILIFKSVNRFEDIIMKQKCDWKIEIVTH